MTKITIEENKKEKEINFEIKVAQERMDRKIKYERKEYERLKMLFEKPVK
jgi:hypothetical protein